MLENSSRTISSLHLTLDTPYISNRRMNVAEQGSWKLIHSLILFFC